MEETLTSCMQGNDSKRGCGYRLAVIQSAAFLRKKALVSKNLLQVLETLTGLQRIMYSSDDSTCPQLILRYYNQAWYHASLLKQLMDCG